MSEQDAREVVEERKLAKYVQLYQLSKEVHLEEVRRFDLMARRAMRYLTVLSFLLGVSVYFGRWLVTAIAPPCGILPWLMCASAALFLVCLSLAWFLSFQILRGGLLMKIPMSERVIRFFCKHRDVDVYFALARRITEGHRWNVKRTDGQSRLLLWAHHSLAVAAVSFLVLVSLGACHIWQSSVALESRRLDMMSSKEPETEPSEDSGQDVEGDTSSESCIPDSSDGEPDPTVEAPPMELLTHGEEKKVVEIGESPEERRDDSPAKEE